MDRRPGQLKWTIQQDRNLGHIMTREEILKAANLRMDAVGERRELSGTKL